MVHNSLFTNKNNNMTIYLDQHCYNAVKYRTENKASFRFHIAAMQIFIHEIGNNKLQYYPGNIGNV